MGWSDEWDVNVRGGTARTHWGAAVAGNVLTSNKKKGIWKKGHGVVHWVKLAKGGIRRSLLPRVRKRRSAAACLLVCGFDFPWRNGCSSLVLVVCCVGSNCDELITHSEESYRVCVCVCVCACVCVCVCVWSRNSNKEAARCQVGLFRHSKAWNQAATFFCK
jgi:hypothetical protein